MIVIYPAKLKIEGDSAIISAEFESQGRTKELWYKVPAEYENYLVTERLDAFLVGLLFLGLKTGQDVKIFGTISKRLYYNLTHYLIPALCLSDSNFKEFKVMPSSFDGTNLNLANVAGTGLSCGIDSFATYYDHILEKESFAINYFTFFNVGSHGDFGGDMSRELFQTRLKSVENFAKGEGKEVLTVDSNLSELLQMNFQKTHSLRSISCVLLFQKLFKNYYYASAYRLDHFSLNSKDTSDFDIFNLNMLSTESTNLYSAVAQFTRVERTLEVAKHPETYNFLDVCIHPWMNNDSLNCSSCYKCLRTQLTLDIAGKLNNYRNVFNLDKYYELRNKYIGELLIKTNKSDLDKELIAFLKKSDIHLPYINYYSIKYWKKNKIDIFKKIIKKKLNRK